MDKRRLYAPTIMSVITYGAPVWCDVMVPVTASARRRQALVLQVQRFVALRVIAAYRSVSLEAALLLACMPPLYLIVGLFRTTYFRVQELKKSGEWSLPVEKNIRDMERLLLNRQWQIHIRRANLSGVRVREAINLVFYILIFL